MSFDFNENVFDKQSDQKSRIDIGSKEQEFTIEEQRLAQNFGGEPKRLQYHRYREKPALSPQYKLLVGNQLWKSHVDRIH